MEIIILRPAYMHLGGAGSGGYHQEVLLLRPPALRGLRQIAGVQRRAWLDPKSRLVRL